MQAGLARWKLRFRDVFTASRAALLFALAGRTLSAYHRGGEIRNLRRGQRGSGRSGSAASSRAAWSAACGERRQRSATDGALEMNRWLTALLGLAVIVPLACYFLFGAPGARKSTLATARDQAEALPVQGDEGPPHVLEEPARVPLDVADLERPQLDEVVTEVTANPQSQEEVFEEIYAGVSPYECFDLGMELYREILGEAKPLYDTTFAEGNFVEEMMPVNENGDYILKGRSKKGWWRMARSNPKKPGIAEVVELSPDDYPQLYERRDEMKWLLNKGRSRFPTFSSSKK